MILNLSLKDSISSPKKVFVLSLYLTENLFFFNNVYLERLSVSELSSSAVRYVIVFSRGLGIFLVLIFSSHDSPFGSLLLLSVNELILSIIIPWENISLTFSLVGPRILSKLCLLPKNNFKIN